MRHYPLVHTESSYVGEADGEGRGSVLAIPQPHNHFHRVRIGPKWNTLRKITIY